MALLSRLVEIIAAAEGIDQTFASGVARYLREAGFVKQAGRGRGAARMSASDGAHLLIGLNVVRVAKDAAEETEAFGKKIQRWPRGESALGLCKSGRTLHQDLEHLIEISAGTIFRSEIDQRHMSASVQFHMPERYTMLTVTRDGPGNEDKEPETVCAGLYGSAFGDNPRAPRPDRTDIVMITSRTITAVADALLE